MPIYEFRCERDDIEIEELRKLGDLNPPVCPKCNEKMERIFSSPLITTSEKQQTFLKKRSREQNTKFFKRHPKIQEMALNRKFPGD